MNAPPLNFECPACGTRLQVPAAMAGAVGPCPRCLVTIQAPLPAAVAVAPPSRPPVTAPPATAPPVAAPPVAAPPATAGPVMPIPLAPSPRELPRRQGQEERPAVPVAPAPWPSVPVVEAPRSGVERQGPRGQRASVTGPPPRPRPRYSWFVRFGVPMLFLLACFGIFAGTWYFMEPKEIDPKQRSSHSRPGVNGLNDVPASGVWPVQPSGKKPVIEGAAATEGTKSGAATEGTKPGAATEGTKSGAATEGGSPTSVTPPTRVPDPAVKDPAPPAPGPGDVSRSMPPTLDGGQPPPAAEATKALEKFLGATGLEARMDVLLSGRSHEQLAATSLAGSLPAPAIPNLDNQVSFPRERLIEYHYTVTFPEAKPPHPLKVKVIVHQRGSDGKPLVLADPFVDLFDGKIREFGKTPSDGLRTFHVVAQAMPRCDSPNVPDAAKKLTVRLLSNDGAGDEASRPDPTRDIAQAYAGKLSPIGEMLNNATSGLRWGQPQPCVVTLQWNTSDDPHKPYLEIVRLDGLTWSR